MLLWVVNHCSYLLHLLILVCHFFNYVNLKSTDKHDFCSFPSTYTVPVFCHKEGKAEHEEEVWGSVHAGHHTGILQVNTSWRALCPRPKLVWTTLRSRLLEIVIEQVHVVHVQTYINTLKILPWINIHSCDNKYIFFLGRCICFTPVFCE